MIESILRRCAHNVFAELCFLMPSEKGETSGERVTITVPFRGPSEGALVLGLQGMPVAEIAANMLGEDEADAAQQRDALAELGNVLCGRVLPLVWGEQAVFDLSSPVVTPGPGEIAGGTATELWFEGGRVEVAIRVDQGSIPRGVS